MPPTDLDTTRRRILSEALQDVGNGATILFEATDPSGRGYTASAASQSGWLPEQGLELPSTSLVLRWLRTNNEYLDIPDAIGVWDELPETERHTLEAWRMSGCAPLVLDEELVGWIGLVDVPGSPRSGRSERVMHKVHAWAVELRDAQVAARSLANAEVVSRSNRLHVTGQLAAGIAHEVRNPLAAIRSTVQLLRDEEIPTASQRRLLGGVLEDVDRVNRVVGDMMTLGKPRSSRRERCDIATLTRDSVSFCEPYAKRVGQRISFQGQTATVIEADPVELRQVLVNLILNACQASRSGDRVLVELEAGDDQATEVILRVADHGIGMPPEVLGRAFEPFYSTKVDGGGLGLAISRDIVRRHSGELVLTSTPGHGTTATIRLPR